MREFWTFLCELYDIATYLIDNGSSAVVSIGECMWDMNPHADLFFCAGLVLGVLVGMGFALGLGILFLRPRVRWIASKPAASNAAASKKTRSPDPDAQS